MVRLILSNLVLAYVAFLLGCYWPREEPRAVILRYPPPVCGIELERLRQEVQRLERRNNDLQGELRNRENIPLIVRETLRIIIEGELQP